MKEKIDIVKQWIRKAENDFINAKNSINIKPLPPLDTVCFHCQQSAEKYLKSFLVFHNVYFGKTHDIGDLIILSSTIDRKVLSLLDEGKKLSPYAVEIRYPLFLEEVSREEAEEALKIATKIREFVLARLSL